MTPLRYHEAAEEELLNEIGYLELQTQGLGRRFFAEVRRAESRIVQFPESAQEIRPASENGHFGHSVTPSYMHLNRMARSFWRWRTIIGVPVIGPVV